MYQQRRPRTNFISLSPRLPPTLSPTHCERSCLDRTKNAGGGNEPRGRCGTSRHFKVLDVFFGWDIERWTHITYLRHYIQFDWCVFWMRYCNVRKIKIQSIQMYFRYTKRVWFQSFEMRSCGFARCFLFHNYRFSLSWVFRIFKQDVHQPYIILTPNPISSDLYKALLSSHVLCFCFWSHPTLYLSFSTSKRYWPKFYKKKGPKTSYKWKNTTPPLS